MEKFSEDKKVGQSENTSDNKYHEDLVRYRHATKNGYQPGSAAETAFHNWEAGFNKREQKIEEYKNTAVNAEEGFEKETSGAVERIKEMIDLVDSAKLLPEFMNDKEQQVLLEEKKKIFKKLISDILQNDLVNYVACVREYNKARVDVQNDNLSAQDFVEYNERRTSKHNVLIDSIRIVTRFLSNNFGTMSEYDLDDYEESLERDGTVLLQVERVALPPNVICPDYLNLDVREDITDWALDISISLAELK